MRLLVSAGPTCEDLDAVRFLTNRSTGRMGYALAGEAAARGHAVTLVSGPTHLAAPEGVERVDVRSAQDMLEALEPRIEGADALVMAAAVADFRPAHAVEGKIEKGELPLALELARTPDVTASLAPRKGARVFAGFALEAEAGGDARTRAEAKMRAKGFDLFVLNDVRAFGAPRARYALWERGAWRELGELAKEELARVLLDAVEAATESRGKA